MGDFKEVVNYLRYTRRSEEASQKHTARAALVIDLDYDKDIFPHEDDLVYVDKLKISNPYFFKVIDEFTTSDTSTLYLKTAADGTIQYYVKRQDLTPETAEYEKLPELDTIEVFSQGALTPIAVPLQTMYDYEANRCVIVLEEELFVYEDIFTYHPNDISLDNGSYIYEYDNNQGYLVKAAEYINIVLNPVLLKINDLRYKEVKLIRSNQPEKVNIFPGISQNNQGYLLKYNRYQKGIPNHSFLSEPHITLRFRHYGALLTFLNNTLFYLFKSQEEDGFLESDVEEVNTLQGELVLETKQKKIFVDNYRYFVKTLLEDRRIDPLKVAFYLPRFYFRKEDKGFLWEVITNSLKSNTTNAINRNEDVLKRLIKLLAVVYYEDKPGLFLTELCLKRVGRQSLMERLIANVDGNNFTELMLFLIRLWITSSHVDPLKRKDIKDGDTILNPAVCGYTSGKSWSFFHENTNFSWTKEGLLALEVETEDDKRHYKYHPLDLIAISNIDNEPIAFTAEKTDYISYIPAFALYAHSDVTFWKNTATAAEYAGDILSIAVGLGPAWRALRIVSAVAKATTTAKKALVIVRSAVGVMEVVAGTGNIILKATQYIDTPFGKKIARVFMWMEFASLGADVSIGIAKKLSASSKLALKEADTLLRVNAKEADALLKANAKETLEAFLKNSKLTLEEFKQLGHVLIAQLADAKYIVGQRYAAITGNIAETLKNAELQIIEFTKETVKFLDELTDVFLDTLGINRYSLDYEYALVNGGYLTTLNGKSVLTSSLDDLKGFFNAMSDHLKQGSGKSRKGGKTIDKVDEAFEVAKINSILNEAIELLKLNSAYLKAYDFVRKYKVFDEFMSLELAAAIRLYTGSMYKNFNKALRGLGNINLSEEFVALKKALNNALDLLPNSSHNGSLKRSVYFSENDIKKLFKEGGDFTDEGFMSTTYSDEALKSWLIDNPTHNVIFKIIGKNGKQVEEAALLPHEAEVLFKSGTIFDVLKVYLDVSPIDYIKEMTYIILKEK